MGQAGPVEAVVVRLRLRLLVDIDVEDPDFRIPFHGADVCDHRIRRDAMKPEVKVEGQETDHDRNLLADLDLLGILDLLTEDKPMG